MVKRFARLLVALHVVSDAVLGMAAFVLAYVVRFDTGLIPVTRGFPPFQQYLNVLPLIGLVVPIAFQIHGMYRLRRHRSRVDDFFGVFVGSVIAVVLGIVSTLYVQTYFLPPELKERGAFEVSQVVWALFLLLNTLLCYGVRELVREVFERRWRAGIGLKRVLIAGSGDLGRLVADKALQHRELGYRVVGFLDDRAEQDHLGYRGLPLLGTLGDVGDLLHREQIDLLYITLPLEEHVKMLSLIEAAARECVEVKVVPDLLQFIALKAGLEDLDGVPIISVNDVPLHGMNSALKRVIDVGLSAAALATLSAPMAAIALLVRYSSPGPVLYRQERMGLDGRPFTVYKFRSMHNQAEADTGPVWAKDNDPRRTLLGSWLRRFNLDELPQLWNVLRGDMSLVGPRPERPYFVEKFKHRFPQYMLRHKVKAGMTGWAQVNGWRGNTSIEKRIEFDLYYIENWSVALDFRILWLTVVRGLFQTHAY
ncbi:MAG: undecaprenyl-phosphate glucose phosphotransferase [Vicinamibacterales bacterium]|nr:undecaprenyl-phosphate glucose phosphotransferase [Acidobacteriota bacterium]MDP6610102.1 undecaprenyl-phosphate glucose phosphotransferase [Vicinamibacterales bacterium]|tara:strand:- start:2888 stop:4327 length:1440 start_codon:yes stop_codon:yes gene_type:complete